MKASKNKICSFLSYMSDYYEDKSYSDILFSYEGEINHQNILTFIQLTEKKFELFHEKSVTRKKVFNVLVELLQNMYNHGLSVNKSNLDSGRGSVLLIHDESYYSIISGNLIENKYVEKMSQVIDKVNQHDNESLREFYKEVLANGRFSDKGGAGLGFIDMARKSENKIGYKFVEINEEFSFFIVEIKINH